MKRLMLAMACLAAGTAFAEVTVSGIFSDNMVLQRGKPVPVWGKAAPGEKIKVEFAGQSVEATADAKGDWTATLAPMEANTNSLTLSVSSTLNSQPSTLNFTNVLVGDVWLVSGQSNSEMSFSWGIINGKEEIAKSKDYPNIRQLKFNHATSPVPRKFRTCNQGQWKVCSEKTLNNITAMGYFFALDINAKTGVPIGLLDDNWSGCAIEPFICREGYAAVPAFTNRLAGIDKAAKDYIASVDKFAEAWLAGDHDAQLPGVGNGPSQQHNAMIEPIVRRKSPRPWPSATRTERIRWVTATSTMPPGFLPPRSARTIGETRGSCVMVREAWFVVRRRGIPSASNKERNPIPMTRKGFRVYGTPSTSLQLQLFTPTQMRLHSLRLAYKGSYL